MSNINTEERLAVSQMQESRGTIDEPILTYTDVDRAWKEQVAAVDRWEWRVMHGWSEDLCEQAWDEMQEATQTAMDVESMYHEQSQRREWLTNGHWAVQPIMGVGL